MLRDGAMRFARVASPDCAALVRKGRAPSARPAKKDKPLRCHPAFAPALPKKSFRRCFKPRRPLRAGFAGFASGCRSREQGRSLFLRRLSGLLSGCPPTDTRPQARAKVSVRKIIQSSAWRKQFRRRDRRGVASKNAGAEVNARDAQKFEPRFADTISSKKGPGVSRARRQAACRRSWTHKSGA